MRLRVLKFGGTSVRTPEARLLAALKVISAKEQGIAPVVVVSAIGRRGEPYATDTLIGLLHEIDPSVTPDTRELDLIMACGEILSAVVFAHLLKTLGHRAMAMRGGQAGIFTDGVYGNARITRINPQAIQKACEMGVIPVVCGFQGVAEEADGPGGELTTLGRGGSDTTASALGASIQAEAIEIYTDVDGIKTADPDFVPGAPTLRTVDYEEVAEIAHLGAKVVHPRAAEIAMKFGIPLWIKSTFTDDPGTEIVARMEDGQRRVTGITHTGKLVSIQFDFSTVASYDRRRFEAEVYALLANYRFTLFMINLSPSGIGWAVPREQYPAFIDLFDGLVMPFDDGMYVIQIGEQASKGAETQFKLMSTLGDPVRVVVNVSEGCTMVSVVGRRALSEPGAFYAAMETLHSSQIPVFQTTGSNTSLSVLIPESELRRTVQLLHTRFGLDGAG